MMTTADAEIPLCIDLDGTLVHADLLVEDLIRLLRETPASIPSIALSFVRRGKAALKHDLANRNQLRPALLPYRQSVLAIIELARSVGRPVVLCTGSHISYANDVAEHLGLFTEVVATTSDVNLTSEAKAQALVARFGRTKFDYVGDSKNDLAVFAVCRNATLVSSSLSLRRRALSANSKVEFIEAEPFSTNSWLSALRLRQWVKNLLIFVPMLASHDALEPTKLIDALVAFIAFGLCASATYVANDIFDLDSDRSHAVKRSRPFASGTIPVVQGLAAAFGLLGLSLVLAASISGPFLAVLLVYVTATLSYSAVLKRQVVVDLLILAALYTLRIVAGGAATHNPPSFWLLAFSMFIFLSLAIVKRVSELQRATTLTELPGRGYLKSDEPALLSLGTGSALVSVLVLALYVQSDAVTKLYPSKGWLWLVPVLVLYWVARLWHKTNRGEIDEDPVLFAVRDWQSIVVLGLVIFLVALSTSGAAPWFLSATS